MKPPITTALRRIFRFVHHLIRLRSVSLARWVDEYENHQPRFKEGGAR